jgi:ATP-dependent RNA helicase RhlE
VILCPTREIAMQTQAAIEKVGHSIKVHGLTIIGGRRMHGQISGLKRGVQILVATPGRLVDHMERRNVDLRTIRYLVLDEADHMLDLGFLPQMRKILRVLPEERQTMMFSATFPHEISQLAEKYLRNPKRVEVTPPGTSAEGVDHLLYILEPQDKRQAILNLLEKETRSTLIFTRTRLDAEWLGRLLAKQGHSVESLHADRSQGERISILEKFKQGEFQMIVATDILARGIDVKDIGHVVNYDIPQTPEDYVHRIGRTARLGATGHASTLATWAEMHFAEAIEKQIGFPLPRKTLAGIKAFEENPTVKSRPLGRVGRKGPRVRMR